MYKRLMLLIAVFALLSIPCMAMAHSLAWDRNNVEPDLAGYNVYDTTTTKTKLNTTGLVTTSACTGTPPAGSCTYAIPTGSHVDGRKFVVTAVDTSGNESGDSNTATMDLLPPATPGSLRIINQ
jgi:hypothetical protein